MLQKGHHNVRLDQEAWDRLITWIDLNGPCHGVWGDVADIPRGADRRRRELALLYGGPKEDPEAIPQTPLERIEPIVPEPTSEPPPRAVHAPGWPFDAREARRRQRADGEWEKTIDMGGGVMLKLVRIPAGEFVMGSQNGEADERPLARVAIRRDFWMGECEITNEQFRRFDRSHYSGLFMKRSLDANGPGVAMDGPRQPVARVSWKRAVQFCQWLSTKAAMQFTLPTEAQWEYACRAGSPAELSFGDVGSDFSSHGNLADKAIHQLHTVTGGVVVLQDIPADTRFDDKAVATTAVGSYAPNAWGLYDMHGNVAEWTLSTRQPYPCRDDDGAASPASEGHRVVRGGSFYDRPKRCRSAFRLSYPAWRRVHNVGFRVVCQADSAQGVSQ
jgi:formylglycine-generating enzyme required for sulfatase activity